MQWPVMQWPVMQWPVMQWPVMQWPVMQLVWPWCCAAGGRVGCLRVSNVGCVQVVGRNLRGHGGKAERQELPMVSGNA